MSKSRSVTVDEIVEYLQSGNKPVYTMSDIADEFNVSTETIRRRMPEVVDRDGVQEGSIGKANVYWFSQDDTIPQTDSDTRRESQAKDDADEDKNVSSGVHGAIIGVALSSALCVLFFAFAAFVNTIAAAFGSPFFGIGITLILLTPGFIFALGVPILFLLYWASRTNTALLPLIRGEADS